MYFFSFWILFYPLQTVFPLYLPTSSVPKRATNTVYVGASQRKICSIWCAEMCWSPPPEPPWDLYFFYCARSIVYRIRCTRVDLIGRSSGNQGSRRQWGWGDKKITFLDKHSLRNDPYKMPTLSIWIKVMHALLNLHKSGIE